MLVVLVIYNSNVNNGKSQHVCHRKQQPKKHSFFFRPPGHGISDKTTITIGDKTFDCDASDLQQRRYLGRGAYGVVEEVEHLPSNTILAVKVGQVEINM